MKVCIRVFILIGLVLIFAPQKAVAQWGDMLKLGVDLIGETDEATDASATPEEQERQKQLGIKLAKKEKKALFELQKSIFILEKMTEIGGELVTAQAQSNYGVFTDGDKFNELIVSMSNLSEVLKDESQVVHDNKLFLKVKVEKIEKNSLRMRSQLDQKKKESESLIEIVNARSSKVPKLLVDKFYPALRNNAKDVSLKLKASIDTINEMMSATTYKSVLGTMKIASGGLGIAQGLSSLSNANSDPSGALLGALQLTEGTTAVVDATTSTASLLSNFSNTMDEFNEHKGAIEEMSVSLLGYIDASKQLHEEGLVLLEEAHKKKTEDARLKQALGKVPDQEELESPFEEEEIQMAALDGLDQSIDAVWGMPVDDVPEGDYKEDLAMQIAEAEKISAPQKEMESSTPDQEAANKEEGVKESIAIDESVKGSISKEGDGPGIFSSIGSWFGGGETEKPAKVALDSGSKLETSAKGELEAQNAMELSSTQEFPAFIQDVEPFNVDEHEVQEETLSTAVLDPAVEMDVNNPVQEVSDFSEVVAIPEGKEPELEKLSALDLDPVAETDQAEMGDVQPVEAEISFEPEDPNGMKSPQEPELKNEAEMLSTATLDPVAETGHEEVDAVQPVEAEISFEPEAQKETEILSTATLNPVQEPEKAHKQAPPTEKTSAERLQEEIDIVSRATASIDMQDKEELAHIKLIPKKKASSVHENVQVAKLEPDAKKKPVREEPVEGYACVQAKKANLRKGPGTTYPKLAQVKLYTPFERLKISGKWIKIKNFQEETFWIYKTLVTEKYICGTVAQDNVDFYTKPDFNSFPFYGAPMSTGFSVRILSLDDDNDWVKVVDSAKNISWVQKSMLWIR
jgi:SH3-like domain-containing protein